MNNWFRFLLGLILITKGILPAGTAHSEPANLVSLILAGTEIELDLPFFTEQFIEADVTDALQVATATRINPFFEVSLAAERSSGLEATTLSSLRAKQAGTALPAHQLEFFGQAVSSQSNQVELNLWGQGPEDVVVHEWSLVKGSLSWTFRVSYAAGSDFDPGLLDQIVLREMGQAPVLPDISPQPALAEPSGASTLPTPAWWSGDCDTNTYKAGSGGISAVALGGSYRGVKACGPRPSYDGAPDVLVRFYPGAWGEYEWECVELSMRYLYLAYGISPYGGNGKDVVANYSGTLLGKVSNGTAGRAPLPGDVLSYGPTTTYGHTSVVAASSVDGSGNGTITVIEQNASATGSKTLTVSNWVVLASMTVSGWLHYPVTPADMPYRVFLPVIGRP